ncbi:D-alanyl-D-alanine carboxypeptidase/D-alanyl-D-alanine endopeptidase [Pseudooceanicola sp. C21-150M6]|uniref:D-alanyl-D-alanine carboxypeptidase/D-alanyl-D-alanine endopeptidase n=1 Tax=Pseudooceanicola sp. C21-150M6 TaxID=3434355 RepID=UPI003D7FE3E3
MSRYLGRRRFITGFAAGLTATALSPARTLAEAPATSLRPVPRPGSVPVQVAPVSEVVARAKLTGQVGCAVAEAETGQQLESFGADAPLPPASVAKALTSLFALDTLGPDHTFTTAVTVTGEVAGGVLKGDLILQGGGDPTLETDNLVSLARSVANTGLKRVEGRFLVWGGALPYNDEIDALQPPQVGYNPSVSGMALNFNRVHFEWKRAGNGWGTTMDARSDRVRPAVAMARMRIVDRGAPLYTYEDSGGTDNWTVALSGLGKGGSRWLPVRKPELYAGEVFRSLLQAEGVTLAAPQVTDILPQGRVLVSRNSAPLTTILKDMLKYSTNLTAEMVGLSATTKYSGRPRDLKDSAQIMSGWARERLGMTKTQMVDHSGLGDDSRTTAGDLVMALNHSLARQRLRPLLKVIEMRDTNYKVMKNHPLSVHAKTGTLNFVSTLAGYAQTREGRDMAFAILTADVPRRDALTEAQRERPDGGWTWNRNSRLLQQALLQRWGVAAFG